MLANQNDICDAKQDMYDANHYDAKYGGDVLLRALVSTMTHVVM